MSNPPYLQPYLRAARTHGGGFPAMLWASPRTQAARFEIIRDACEFSGRSVLDVGCGRADFLGFLHSCSVEPADYTGIEAVDPLADAAEHRLAASGIPARIIRADFVVEPARMFVGADVVVFSGSLNTADDETFYETLRRAYDAATEVLVFNFLSSDMLAARDYLVWRPARDVAKFCKGLGGDVQVREDYLDGDCTIAVRKFEIGAQ